MYVLQSSACNVANILCQVCHKTETHSLNDLKYDYGVWSDCICLARW